MTHSKAIYAKIEEYNDEVQAAIREFERKFLLLVDEHGANEVYEAAKEFSAEEMGDYNDSVESVLRDWLTDHERSLA